jgi:hypothetical protein
MSVLCRGPSGGYHRPDDGRQLRGGRGIVREVNDADVQVIAKDMAVLLPLREDDVERYEELVGELEGIGSGAAARQLLEQLDDACALEEVMQTVTTTLCAFPPPIVVTALLDVLPSVIRRGPVAARDVVRSLLLSDEGRARLLVEAPKSSARAVAGLRELLDRVGRFERYAQHSNEVLAALSGQPDPR